MSENQEPQEEPTQEEEPQEPIGGAGGIPYPSRSQRFGKLPGLTMRQTYSVIVAIPTIQVAVAFLLFVFTWTDLYKISYSYFLQITGFSLIVGLYQWYMAKLSGSCTGAMFSIYTLITINIINIIHLVVPINYYLIYGIVISGVGLLFSIAFYKYNPDKRSKT